MADLHDQLRGLLGLGSPSVLPEAHSYFCPDGPGPHPAVLYCHAPGGEYGLGRRELTEGARWLVAPYAPDLLAAGWAVLCIDMPGFGDRAKLGTESALVKAGLWQGRPYFGWMVAEQIAGLQWLAARCEIDATRIITLGMSMGGALSLWTAALEPRIAACVHLCFLADIAPLIATGAHDRHGHYLTVPGFLPLAETGDVAALIAPRPQFVGHGSDDALTPASARDAALARLRTAYSDDALRTFMAERTGHVETPEMRRHVLDFLRHLQTAQNTRTSC